MDSTICLQQSIYVTQISAPAVWVAVFTLVCTNRAYMPAAEHICQQQSSMARSMICSTLFLPMVGNPADVTLMPQQAQAYSTKSPCGLTMTLQSAQCCACCF